MTRRQFTSDEPHWYALDVVRQKEYVAGHIFNRLGWETFIPTTTRYRKRNRYARAKVELAYAALPGLVFVGFPSPPDWYRVMRMHLVNGVLSTDGRPRRIDTHDPQWLAWRAGQSDGRLIVETVRQYRYVKELGRRSDIEVSAPSIHVEGRGLLRAPEVQRHMKSNREFDRGDRVLVSDGPFRFTTGTVVRIAGTRAKLLLPLFGGDTEIDIALEVLEVE